MPDTADDGNVQRKLLGTWTLVGATSSDEFGAEREKPYGERPSGMLFYGEEGRMLVLIAHDGRPLLDGDRQAAPDHQKAAAFSTCISYAGRYEVASGKVIHDIDISTYPNWIGKKLIRLASFEENHLDLRTPLQMQNGVMRSLNLTWVKCSPLD